MRQMTSNSIARPVVEEREGLRVQLLVPVYNEGENVRELYEQLLKDQVEFDVLRFVYDFDKDTTLPVIDSLMAEDTRVTKVKNTFGRGALNALRYGFSVSTDGPVIVLMGDNSDKLSIIPDMVEFWKQGFALVAPSRYMPGGEQHGGGFLKSNLSRLAGKSLRLFGFPTADATNNFKLYDGRWLKRQIIESRGGFEVALELTYKAFIQKQKITEIPTVWKDRVQGESQFRLFHWLPHYLRWYFKAIKSCVLPK